VAERSGPGHLVLSGFDLLFGAAKLNLKIVEMPIRYVDRAYGETQISRFRHGGQLSAWSPSAGASSGRYDGAASAHRGEPAPMAAQARAPRHLQ
jgi:hypothetical protein